MSPQTLFAHNDNALDAARPLNASDFIAILDEFSAEIGRSLDSETVNAGKEYEPRVTPWTILFRMPDLQRAIAWRGSWLKRDEVNRLPEGMPLFKACLEVILLTWAEWSRSSMTEIIETRVRPFSRFLDFEAA